MKQNMKLLMARESKEVVGRRGQNLWLLTLVLIATFASIAFSEGSMIYLKEKMEDPFTNWVNIVSNQENAAMVDKFRDSLLLPENQQRYDYSQVLMDQFTYRTMMGSGGRMQYLSIRFFERMKTSLMDAILSEENLMANCHIDTTLIVDQTMGLILSMEAARRLGYDENHLPSYISYLSYNEGADSLGLKLVQGDLLPVSLPVLAVVRRLPGNVDIIGSNFLFEQFYNDATHPFDFCTNEADYLHSLLFFVVDGQREAFEQAVKKNVADSLRANTQFFILDDLSAMQPWKIGSMVQVDLGGQLLPRESYQQVADAVTQTFSPDDVQRVFRLAVKERSSRRGSYLSVAFRSLRHISEFEDFAKRDSVQLEMEQVHSKQNFDAVTRIAAVLSAAMVVFAIVCIIMFMVNMLQAYFQKVKRNIGTFKAFGMNAKGLIEVYIIILVAIVCAAVILALLITWAIQLMLPLVGVEKDGFNYLSLWCPTTYVAAGIILASTVVTVVVVMTRLLSQTPGDLIYDRN
jgi:hypothetical protein